MKKGVLIAFFLVVFASFSYAGEDDADFDGVPDYADQCPYSDTTVVGQFGCSCAQKNCPSDNNECTDDCSVIDGLASCTFTNNNRQCQGGYCANGRCVTSGITYTLYDPNNCNPVIGSGNLLPSGVVQASGDITYTPLIWPSVEGAIHYNVRLDDGTAERFDDPRFSTCPENLHYFCENYITGTSIDNVPVKQGRTYLFWVDPIIPSCGYLNLNINFNVVARTTPLLLISPAAILPGDSVTLSVSNAQPNSNVLLYEKDVNNVLLINGDIIGNTDSNGVFTILISATNNWAIGTYGVWVGVAGVQSNEVEFIVI